MINREMWTLPGFAERVMAAHELFRETPAALSERDIEALAAYYGNGDIARRKREAAIAAEATRIQETWASPQALMAQIRMASLPSEEDMASDEAQERWAELNAECAVPVWMWKAAVMKNRAARQDLEANVERLNVYFKDVARLEQRIATLEATTPPRGVSGARWAGIHEGGREYASGEIVTARSALWICTCETTTATPGTDPSAWTLILRRPKD
jgi:hypothetical protein